ncbi:HAD family hydrolase [Streptococcus ovuberis]|uniref:HAD family hydrolase n=1 Tax=Streptococcus ovuberis TaxID=1936207 RepID=A0A7X6MXS9_9STRE|nr:HAD family hydrolase [Streptococcus ovuberis]NKZ19453.1 HAD family hydrolase [Streptococcus ovuberis]
MLKWVFFDIGSTLVDEEEAYQDFVKRCIERSSQYGIEISSKIFYAKMLEIAKQGGDPINDVWKIFMPEGIKRPKWSHDSEKLYPNVALVLKQLRERYCLGVIANQGKGLEDRLEMFGIRASIDLIISSSDVGLKKPDPAIFQCALTLAGIPAQQAVYIGDRVDNDMIPAKCVGMKTIRVRQGLGKYAPEQSSLKSDHQIDRITDLLTLL